MFVAGLAGEEVAGAPRSGGISQLEVMARLLGRADVNLAMTSALCPVQEATDDIEGALSALADAFPTKRDTLGQFLRVYSFALRFLDGARATLDRVASELRARELLTAEEIEDIVGSDLPIRRRSA
jgi:hypothetical protein